MACNCETQNQIERLYKEYGDKSSLPEKPTIFDYVKYYGGNIFAYALMFICFPLLLMYILALLFWRENETININDINLIKKFKFLKI